MTIAALRRPEATGITMTLAGPTSWTTQEIIGLCERLSGGSDAKITKVPVWILKITRNLLSSFQWAKEAADRLAFTDIVHENSSLSAEMEETYKLLGLDPAETLG